MIVGDYDRMGAGVMQLIVLLFVMCCVFVPFGVWKMIELIISVCKHIHFS